MKLEAKGLKLETEGNLLAKGADAYLKLVPGRTIVSIAHARRKTEEVFTECVNDLVQQAERNGWSQELLMWRVQSAAEGFGKRMNLEEVVSHTIPLLDEGKELDEETVDAIDSEWMHALVDHAENTSDEDMREIISAILAGEVNTPGSYSKGTVVTLSQMDSNQIRVFEKLCRYIVYPSYFNGFALEPRSEEPILVLNRTKAEGGYADGAVTYQEIMELEVLGLVSINSVRNYTLTNDVAFPLLVGDEYAIFSCDVDKNKKLTFSIVLTRTGVELSRLFEERDVDSLRAELSQKAEESGFLIGWVTTEDRQTVSKPIS